jgi:hypothetical protein
VKTNTDMVRGVLVVRRWRHHRRACTTDLLHQRHVGKPTVQKFRGVSRGVTLAVAFGMRPFAIVLVWVGLVAGCKSMGGVASGVGHAASGVGSVVGHAAGELGHVAAPVMRTASTGVAKAAPAIGKVGEKALEAGEVAAEILAAAGPDVDLTSEPPQTAYSPAMPAGDLCLDCPDAGNCASCPQPRYAP